MKVNIEHQYKHIPKKNVLFSKLEKLSSIMNTNDLIWTENVSNLTNKEKIYEMKTIKHIQHINHNTNLYQRSCTSDKTLETNTCSKPKLMR
jgi:hypothetical protein